ncbi:polyphosphate polymerase domain-containing protein [Rarobacter incanus]|uniref:VTC domain-containing protein n=1 Tax=Rarobacter incanus TaxID=153494 RepID=A0A542SMB2_9MICO|nr:polyphosphate polymerase domain-containing protein [Rarobacter incanus]TQK75387.1 VTC domain-containing protein [Rarobacter incanus]
MNSSIISDLAKDLPLIGLDQLPPEAALLSRIDRKYVMEHDRAIDLLRAAQRRANQQAATYGSIVAGAQAIARYQSLYFDTQDRASYQGAAARRRRRFKVRTRSYLDTGTSFLEVKTRQNRAGSVKTRIPIAFAPGMHQLTAVERNFVDERLQDARITATDVGALAPVISTRYDRLSLLQPDGASRVTIDTDLQWGAGGQITTAGGLVVVETKSTTGRSEFDRLLWERRIRPTKISKFGTGCALMWPELPGNAWARVVRTINGGK